MGSNQIPAATKSEAPLDVAIIGSGIVGVMTALGLCHRGIRVTIYERASQHADTGAAFGVTAVGRESMKRVNPEIHNALIRVSGRDPSPMVQYWDGFGPRTKEAAEDPSTGLMFEAPEKDLGFVACMRSQFLLAMVKELPEGAVQFDKQVVGFTDKFENDNAKVVLSFADGTFAEADAGMSSGFIAYFVCCRLLLTCTLLTPLIQTSHRVWWSSFCFAQCTLWRRPSCSQGQLHPQDSLSRASTSRRCGCRPWNSEGQSNNEPHGTRRICRVVSSAGKCPTQRKRNPVINSWRC